MIMRLAICVFVWASGFASAWAQSDSERWFGVLDVGVQRLRLEVRVQQDASGAYTGNVISLDQKNTPLPLKSFSIQDGQLEFSTKTPPASFAGTLNEAKDVAHGTWTQGARGWEMSFRKVEKTPVDTHLQSWQGILEAGPRSFEFQVRIFQQPDGLLFAKLDSFNEKLEGLAIKLGEQSTADSSEFNFEVPISAAKFEGKRVGVNRIEGVWKQNSIELPLNFEKVALAETRVVSLRRPQTPKPPFEYSVSDHTIESAGHAGVSLAGTLTIPEGEGPFPGVILISGSGPQDRDETIFGHKAFLVLAHHFANHGIAAFRYDERGIGQSKGDFASATSADLADDVETIVDWLQQQPGIDADRIVLIGHSEGGYIAPMIASRRGDISAIVLLAGTGVSGREIVLDQSRRIAKVAGASDSILDAQETFLKNMISMLSKKEERGDDFFKQLMDRTRQQLPEPVRNEFKLPPAAEASVSQLDSPWFKFFLEYDPAPALANLQIPVLALFGENDLQVHPDLNVPAMKKALENNPSAATRVERLPKLNHLFQKSETGSPSEYLSIEETFDPQTIEKITDWILQLKG